MAQKTVLAKAPDLQRYVVKDAKPTGVVLGRGSYGTVLEFKTSGTLCAGKKLHDVFLDAQGEGWKYMVDKFKQECQLLAALRYPNIVQFLGLAFLPDSSVPCLLMERLHCSLDEFLENRRNIAFSIKRSILLDVSNGLVCLHERTPPVVHRDLTSKNVLLTSALTAKLADLGNSRLIDPNQLSSTMTTAPGTSVYMPPEALQQSSRYSPKLDIFSFGHLSLYVLTETFPCDLLPPNEPDPKNQDKLIPQTEVQRRAKYFTILRSKMNQKKHQPLVKLVEQCLHNSPARRPTALELHIHLEALPVESDDDPDAIFTESLKLKHEQEAHLNKSLEESMEKGRGHAGEKIGMLKQHKSSGRMNTRKKRASTVILKISMGKYLQILKQHEKNSKPLKQVEFSDIEKVEAVPGDDFLFEVHFKDVKKPPWEFSALSEEERSSWIEAITCSLRGRPLYQHQSKEEKNEEREEEKTHEEETQPDHYETLSPVKTEADKTRPPILTVQLSEVTKPIPIPGKDNHLLSPTTSEEPLYVNIPKDDDDLSPSPRERTHGFSMSPERKRQDWPFHQPRREICPLPNDPQCNLYESMDDVYSTPASENRRAAPCLLPIVNQDQEQRSRVRPSSPVRYRLSSPSRPRSRPSSPSRHSTLANRASQYFDSQQVSLLMQMFQQLQEYLEPVYDEVPSQPSNALETDTASSMFQSPKFSPEQMLLTEEEAYFERPQWAKARVTANESVTVTGEMCLSEVKEDVLTILPSSLSGIEKIGDGQFGNVYKAILQNSEGENIQVAMKTTKVYSEGEMRNFKREMTILSKMMHPNVVQLFGVVQEGEYAPSIVVQFQSHGDLKTFLMGNKCSHRQLMKYMVDVAMGMHYISEKGLVHRDLAARNVLIGENEACKISDFGLLRELPKDNSLYISQSDTPCPVRWMAPESIKKREFSTASDVWSFGILQWEMFNPSKIPYPNMNNVEFVLNVSQGYTQPIPRGCPSIVAKVMRSCWSQNPARRPSFFLIATTLSKAPL